MQGIGNCVFYGGCPSGEGDHDGGLIQRGAERSMLLRGAISKEIEEAREVLMPRFHGTNLRAWAAVVRYTDEASLKWLEDRICGVSS